MSPEIQRIAIAKACGWEKEYAQVPVWDSELHKYERKTTAVWRSGGRCVVFEHLPDYLNDLNAMHEAVKVLDANQRLDFACHLTEPVRDRIYEVMPRDLHYTVCFPAINATAAQRAEAFLRTLKLWNDAT